MGSSNKDISATRFELHTSVQKYADSPCVIAVESNRIAVWKAVARND
jgi:hypothetical protein